MLLFMSWSHACCQYGTPASCALHLIQYRCQVPKDSPPTLYSPHRLHFWQISGQGLAEQWLQFFANAVQCLITQQQWESYLPDVSDCPPIIAFLTLSCQHRLARCSEYVVMIQRFVETRSAYQWG